MNSGTKKFVLDTHVLVSAALYPNSRAAQAVELAFAFGTVFRSRETWVELQTVLRRAKFDRYFAVAPLARETFLSLYEKHAIEMAVAHQVRDCADHNMFLSLALCAHADILVSGDKEHLLPMNPYHGMAILTVRDFGQRILADGSFL